MKVCYILTRYHPLFSGHAIQLDKVRTYLIKKGIDVEVWAHRLDDSPVRELFEGYPVRRFGPRGDSRASSYLRTLHMMAALILERDDYDILHVAAIDYLLRWTILAARIAGRPQVLHTSLMDSDDAETLLRHPQAWLFRPLYKRVERWIALGTALQEAYLRTGLDPARLEVIPGGVELDRYAPPEDQAAVRRSLELPVDRPIVAMVGAVIKRKGYDLLVEAAASIVKRVPNALFLCVGPDSFRGTIDEAAFQPFVDGLKARIAALGLTDHVRFVGQSSNVAVYLQASDVFAFPSRSEGLGYAAVEAAAVGLPVVIADMPGISTDIVVEGQTGYIIPQEDVDALADRLTRLLEDPVLRQSFGRKGREYVIDRFDMVRVVDQYVALYQGMMAEAGKAG